MATTTPAPIKATLEKADWFRRRACGVCGGSTDSNAVLALTDRGTVICDQCLASGDIPARLRVHADGLERRAAELRALAAHRWDIPTHEEWKGAQLDAEYWRYDELERDADCQHPDHDAYVLGDGCASVHYCRHYDCHSWRLTDADGRVWRGRGFDEYTGIVDRISWATGWDGAFLRDLGGHASEFAPSPEAAVNSDGDIPF